MQHTQENAPAVAVKVNLTITTPRGEIIIALRSKHPIPFRQIIKSLADIPDAEHGKINEIIFDLTETHLADGYDKKHGQCPCFVCNLDRDINATQPGEKTK